MIYVALLIGLAVGIFVSWLFYGRMVRDLKRAHDVAYNDWLAACNINNLDRRIRSVQLERA